MARMHTRKQGRSGSKRPANKTAPLWGHLEKEEAVELILKLAREGKSEATIGRILRDSNGVPSIRNLTGKSISETLREKKAAGEYPSDLLDLIKKAVRLRRHLKVSGQDVHNKAALIRTESKIRRLVKYYRGKRLPAAWKYDPEQAALMVK